MREDETTVTVRFCEVDAYGVAWHGHYLAWMEVGRNALAGGFGLSAADISEAGYMAPVIQLEVKYRKPARFGEKLHILTAACRMETATLAFESRIMADDGSLCAEGRTVHAFTDSSGNLLYRLPEPIMQRVERMLAWTEGA